MSSANYVTFGMNSKASEELVLLFARTTQSPMSTASVDKQVASSRKHATAGRGAVVMAGN